MKKMNSISACFIFLCSLLLLASSCSKDDPPARDKFIASYQVSETCGVDQDNYQISIVASSTNGESIVLNNFFNVGGSVTATVNGDNFTINAGQTISLQGTPLTVTGNGSLNGTLLNLNFTLAAAGQGSLNCTAAGQKL